MSLTLDLRAKYTTADTTEYHVTDRDFEAVEKSLAKGGDLAATITTTACPVGLNLDIKIKGNARVECDRCLEDMNIGIDIEESIKIQFADRYEESDDIIYVDQNQQELNLWPIIYDLIVLAIPLTHTHADGECNEEMTETLRKYLVTSPANDESEYQTEDQQ